MTDMRPYIGRPCLFEDPVELQKNIDAYFESLIEEKWEYTWVTNPKTGIPKQVWNPVMAKDGKIVMGFKEPPMITGLAVFLDTNRTTLMMCGAHVSPEIANTIKKAKAKIEHYYEMANDPPALKIFKLKNFDWKDKQEIEATQEVKHSVSTIELDERIAQIADRTLDERLWNALQ